MINFLTFSLGIGIEESGLLNRIAYYLMGKLPKTIKGQSLAVIVSGLVVSPVIPALSGKMALISKLSFGIAKSIGL